MAITSLSELRKSRGNITELTKNLQKTDYQDPDADIMWNCTLDKAGNGSAIVRFLPAKKGEKNTWACVYTHAFQGPSGKWFIENSLTTFNDRAAKHYEDDPVKELNDKLYETKDEEKIKIAKKQGRKANYFANVLIVDDPANPDNNGKVFVWKFNKTIFGKIDEALNPQFEGDEAWNPFDFWDGANFRVRITKKEEYANFDSCKFDRQSEIADSDEAIEAIWDKCHSIDKYLDREKNFKTYDQLAKRLNEVLGTKTTEKANQASQGLDAEDQEFIRGRKSGATKETVKETPNAEQFDDVPPFDADPAPKETKKTETPKKSTAKQVEDSVDDDLAFFRNLANS
jgi:hypothetical protein